MSQAPRIQIQIANQQVGFIEFDESEAGLFQLGGRRTADGFVTWIPARLTLEWQTGQWQPFVSDLRAVLFVDDNSGSELGVAVDNGWYTSAKPRLDGHSIQLEWRGTLEALQLLERRRNGARPKLWIQVTGQVARMHRAPLAQGQAQVSLLRGSPERIYQDVHVSYPQDSWAKLVDGIGVIGNVIVEMPVRKDFPAEWKEIYAALDESKRNLVRGGDEGWKGCVGAVRLALEKWRKMEKEDLGPGWKPPSTQDRDTRTKAQRIDGIRWHLLQLAHLSPHSSADNWQRSDAILAVAALAGLLDKRNP